MTDLRQHLKGIYKVVSTVLTQAEKFNPFELHPALRAYLPTSYGITQGVIHSPNGISEPIPTLLYDVPLAGDNPQPLLIEHCLLALETAYRGTEQAFREMLHRIASIKHFKGVTEHSPRQHIGQDRYKIPKDRLPYALIYLHDLQVTLPTSDTLSSFIAECLSQYPHELRPDEIIIHEQHLHYLNPLLEKTKVLPYEVGLSHTPDLKKPLNCYCCKRSFYRRHGFYRQLCLSCAELNYHKRQTQADLTGRIALVTGGRIKIGYETGLRLLRAGAEVIVTSRFPHNTAQWYSQASDSHLWGNRLHVYGLDLRQLGRLEAFIEHLYQHYPHLDALINNAAQTIKRPAAFYAHLLPLEATPRLALPQTLSSSLTMSASLPYQLNRQLALQPTDDSVEADFPLGQYDEHGQQVDNRPQNSWITPLEDLSPAEILEVQMVNAVAPAILISGLKGLLLRSPYENRYIMNVTAIEGQFTSYKTPYHPHTNMAKAALNMLTRTIGPDYASQRIYVNSIDPGWVSNQIPRTDQHSPIRQLPIDMQDAAARLCDPIFSNQQGYGQLLKDYQSVPW